MSLLNSNTGLDQVIEEKLDLTLYIAGWTPNSRKAYNSLTKICQEILPDKCRIEIVDLLVEPEKAKTDQIVAIPTLVKKSPLPIKKIIGDLSDREKLYNLLNIS